MLLLLMLMELVLVQMELILHHLLLDHEVAHLLPDAQDGGEERRHFRQGEPFQSIDCTADVSDGRNLNLGRGLAVVTFG